MTGATRKTVTGIPTRVEHDSSHLFAQFPQLGTAFRLGSAERDAHNQRRAAASVLMRLLASDCRRLGLRITPALCRDAPHR
jgi:hypothetical protein